MKLSAAVYRLKRQARLLARNQGLRLHEALDQIAAGEGYASWSLLASRLARVSQAKKLLAAFSPGELVLVAARPGQGKTRLSLEIAVEAMSQGHRAVFFSLEYSALDLVALFAGIDRNPADFRDLFEFDGSDSICADYIIEQLAEAPGGTVVVVDYLQLLDQKRTSPQLEEQVAALRAFAERRGVIMLFVSQIDRRFDLANRSCPGLDDLRLPNPLDLEHFAGACFLNDGKVHLAAGVSKP